MMKLTLPNGEDVLIHMPQGGSVYDPVKAHEYYMRTRQLKGRKPGQTAPPSTQQRSSTTQVQAKQQIAQRITLLEGKLVALENLIKKKEAALKRGQEAMRNKKPTAADKSKQAEEAKKYRSAHRQELKAKARKAAQKSGGSKAGTATPDAQKPIKELKMLATKVRGQLQAAKTKLTAL